MIFLSGIPLLILLLHKQPDSMAVSGILYLFLCLALTTAFPHAVTLSSLRSLGKDKKQTCLCCLISLLLTAVFFFRWISSQKFLQAAARLPVPPGILLVCVCAALCFAGACSCHCLAPVFRALPKQVRKTHLTAALFFCWILSPNYLRMADAFSLNPLVLLFLICAALFSASRLPFLKNGRQESTAVKHTSARNILTVTVLTVLFLFVQSRLPIWGNTDNYYISNVLNGIYSSENYCCFLNPAIAWLVRATAHLLPSADGFALIQEFLVTVGIWCILFLLTRFFSAKTVCLSAFLLSVLNLKLNLLHLPFTSSTSVLVCIGFFLCYAAIRKEAGLLWGAVGVFYIVFSSLIRFKAFMLMLPFAALAILADLAVLPKEKRKEFLRRSVLLLAPAVLLTAAFYVLKLETDSSELYAPGVDYNRTRVLLVDYEQKPWAQIAEPLSEIGVSENDLSTIHSLIIADTDWVTAERMNSISAISHKDSGHRLRYFLDSGLVNEMTAVRANSALKVQLILLTALLILFLFSGIHWIRKLELVFSMAGAFLEWAYLAYSGHVPTYVAQAILLGVWFIFGAVAVSEKPAPRRRELLCIACLLLSVVLLNSFSGSVKTCRSNLFASLHAKDSHLAQFPDTAEIDDHPDAVFIWGVYDLGGAINQSDFLTDHKLLSQEFIRHNLVDGEWQYGQPYYLDYLADIQIPNPMRALIDREHTYYIANEERCRMVLTYLQEHYGENITVTGIGENQVGEFSRPVWQFSVGE